MNPNPNNYGTREACQWLVDAGVVIERDESKFSAWYHSDGELYIHVDHEWLYRVGDMLRVYEPNVWESLLTAIPAYTFEEVWRELPEGTALYKEQYGHYRAWAGRPPVITNTNPTDALIDLLIYIKRKGE
jgi:hypothetical protein